jgi:hypothetical protein
MLVAITLIRPVKPTYAAAVYVTVERAEQLVLEGKATVKEISR